MTKIALEHYSAILPAGVCCLAEQHGKWLDNPETGMQLIKSEALFAGIDMRGMDFTRAFFNSCKFVECDFTNTVLHMADFSYCIFIRCNFTNVDLTDTVFYSTLLEDCDISAKCNIEFNTIIINPEVVREVEVCRENT
jgi:hypothetical protein